VKLRNRINYLIVSPDFVNLSPVIHYTKHTGCPK
jgi:hypothetical protein